MASLTKAKILEYLDSGLIEINPIEYGHIECNSYDYRLHPEFRTTETLEDKVLDVKKDMNLPLYSMEEEGLVLYPGNLYLMSTLESFTLADSIEAFVDGRSTLARYGISTHLTAGNIKPGFSGKITLEVTCVLPVRVYPYMRFGQVMFSRTDGPPSAYRGRYQYQTGAQTPFNFLIEEDE